MNKENENDYLYQENILEHVRNPKNKKELFLTLAELESNNNIKIISEKGDNPDCGDSGILFLKIKSFEKENVSDHIILEASFTGSGCAISQASFDMFAEELNGKLISEIKL
jgi:nitrogen fixation NifU-like protein